MKTVRSITFILLCILLAGCSDKNPADTNKITIRGSNTVGEELAPRLIAEYKKKHSGITFDLESKGTGYGFGNLFVGGCDIAAASRAANTNELVTAKDYGIELTEHVIGSYSVAIVANTANPVADLTRAQVRDIFTGVVKNWKDVGGTDAPIHLYIRNQISGTYLGFQELAMEGKPYALEPKAFTNYLGIVQAVAKDANGIGYSSIELATSPGVKGVSIGGVPPTIASVQGGKYPYARLLHFYTDKPKESAATSGFIEYVVSSDGQSVLTEMGYVPHP
jgi:phosphate transport system substrate-binding protein